MRPRGGVGFDSGHHEQPPGGCVVGDGEAVRRDRPDDGEAIRILGREFVERAARMKEIALGDHLAADPQPAGPGVSIERVAVLGQTPAAAAVVNDQHAPVVDRDQALRDRNLLADELDHRRVFFRHEPQRGDAVAVRSHLQHVQAGVADERERAGTGTAGVEQAAGCGCITDPGKARKNRVGLHATVVTRRKRDHNARIAAGRDGGHAEPFEVARERAARRSVGRHSDVAEVAREPGLFIAAVDEPHAPSIPARHEQWLSRGAGGDVVVQPDGARRMRRPEAVREGGLREPEVRM